MFKYDYFEDIVNFSFFLSILFDLGGLFKIEELLDIELLLEGYVFMLKGNVMFKCVVVSIKGICIILDGEIDIGISCVEFFVWVFGDKFSLLSLDLFFLLFEI